LFSMIAFLSFVFLFRPYSISPFPVSSFLCFPFIPIWNASCSRDWSSVQYRIPLFKSSGSLTVQQSYPTSKGLSYIGILYGSHYGTTYWYRWSCPFA
jgi:hypothetical protein